MPRVSIIIPTKNEETLLPKLLDSIASQSFRDYEVIVADANSTDQTTSIAQHAGALVVEGGMPGPGRNRGAQRAQGEILLFVDADVQLPSRYFLKDCVAEMREKQFDVATCKVAPLSQHSIDRALYEAYNAYAIATESLRPHAPGSCIFARRSTHEEVRGFDERVVFAEDHEYVQRAQRAGHRFGILRSHPITVSVRRLEKDGRLSIAFKYILCELRMMTRGPCTEPLFEYEMGGAKAPSKDQRDHTVTPS